ncbi:MAG: hypothetical protein Q8904_13505 [Bacteroidota bacterium]|nr:hypothetical protein [Bacteroidota bacterium]
MKKITFLLLLFITVSIAVFGAKPLTIINPPYELKKSGLYNVDKIELGTNETLVYLHISFCPHWWVSFTKPECIIDCKTGKKYEAVDLKGAKFDEKIWMPDSGDSTIVIVFPPLDKNVKKVDYNTEIFGISLEKNVPHVKVNKETPAKIKNWLNNQLNLYKPRQNDANSFFRPDTVHIVGYLNGYDKRFGFTSGMIQFSNAITNEPQTVLLKIAEDGKFEAHFPLAYPQYLGAVISNQYVPFYVEPGSTLSIGLNWSEFLVASRNPSRQYVFKNIHYTGLLEKLNTELNSVILNETENNKIEQYVNEKTPEIFKAEQLKDREKNLNLLEEARTKNSLSDKAVSILKNKISLQSGIMLFEYAIVKASKAMKSNNGNYKQVLPADYYDFTNLIPLNDKSMLINKEFSIFIHRFEHSEPFLAAPRKAMFKPGKDIYEYSLEKKNLLSASDLELISFVNRIKNNNDSVSALQKRATEISRFFERNKSMLEDYTKNYLSNQVGDMLFENNLKDWKLKDSVLLSKFGLQTNFVYETMKVRTLKSTFNQVQSDKIVNYWSKLKKGITDSLLVRVGSEYLNEKLQKTAPTAYALPDTTGTSILKKIIDPFKGKQLFISFWALNNSVSTRNITETKSRRDMYIGNRDFDFIFISEEQSAYQEDYDTFVKEQELAHSFRLTTDEFNYIRQLFAITSLPRDVIIDAKGNVKNDNFNINLFDLELDAFSK